MRLPKLDITTGEVVKVQLTTETHVAGRGGGRGVSSRVLNKMRIFLKLDDRHEKDFSFTNSTVGVREGHTVSVVHAHAPDAKEPLLLMLHNHVTGQREEVSGAFARVVSQRSLGARWRALGAAGVAGVILWGVLSLAETEHSPLWAGVALAAVAFPLVWLAFAGFDRIVLPARERELAERLRAETDGRLRPMDRIDRPAQS